MLSDQAISLKAAWGRDLKVKSEEDGWNKLLKEMLNPMRDTRSKLSFQNTQQTPLDTCEKLKGQEGIRTTAGDATQNKASSAYVL